MEGNMDTQDVRLFWKNSENVENTSTKCTGVRIKKVAEKMLRREGEPVNEMTPRCSRKAERVRRDRMRDSINALDTTKQSEAWAAEWERREIWDQENEEHKRKVDPEVDGQDSSNLQGSSSRHEHSRR